MTLVICDSCRGLGSENFERCTKCGGCGRIPIRLSERKVDQEAVYAARAEQLERARREAGKVY